MNAPASTSSVAAALATAPAALNLPFRVSGRVRSFRRRTVEGGTVWHTLVTLPAPDEFSSPGTVEIRSESKLSDVGETVFVLCRVTGRYRTYETTDKRTGEVQTVTTADCWLYAV